MIVLSIPLRLRVELLVQIAEGRKASGEMRRPGTLGADVNGGCRESVGVVW